MTNDLANPRDVGLLEQRENATFRSQKLAAVPSDLLTMHNLLIVDLSHNQITRFPGELFVQDVPRLEVLHLQHNLLCVLEDILVLSVAPRLRELNVSANPLRLIDNRIYFLEALFGSPGCDTKALRMVHKDVSLTANVVTNESVADSENAAKGKASGARTRTRAARSMHMMRKLPRRSGFPMLQKLNARWIMDDEILAVERERGRALEYYEPRYSASSRCVTDCAPKATSRDCSLDGTLGAPNGRRFDGSRMTAKELLKKSSRSAAIPEATVIQRFQIDVDNNSVMEQIDQAVGDQEASDEIEGGEETHEVIRRLFARNATVSNGPFQHHLHKKDANSSDEMPWNHPIRSFDTLASDERQYIRHRSKQSVESNLQRDDHFFDSSIYLDCIAQAERSRRLTIRAVDTLCPLPRTSLSSSSSQPTFHSSTVSNAIPVSTAAAELRQTLSMKFTKESDDAAYRKIEAFLRNPPSEAEGSTNDREMQGALGELFMTEHIEHRQQIRQLLAAQDTDSTAGGNPLDVVATQLDDSLSRTKLRNAVDLANAMLLNKRQEKRMMQMLIDADARAIEHERAALEQALHRHRLDLIATNTFYANEQTAHEADREWMAKAAKHAAPSPWQARNWRAKEAKRRAMVKSSESDHHHGFETKINNDDENVVSEISPHRASSKHSNRNKHVGKLRTPIYQQTKRPASTSQPVQSQATVELPGGGSVLVRTKFRSIETVEQAARDSLEQVDSHDLLVRCAAIRQHTDQHTQSLAQYRDKFLEEEAAWEAMRQDPINIVRRHLRRKLYQDAQEIQIAGTQLFYSSLFQ